MKNKWDKRVYIDLYSGPGYSRVSGKGKILQGSPFLALGVQDQFDKYIFCESNHEYLNALRQRVARLFPDADAEFIAGDCNEKTHNICDVIRDLSRNRRVLSFCFVDPFDVSIKFSTQ